MKKSCKKNLLVDIQNCRLCESELPFAPNPVLQVSFQAKVVIIGQAPGVRAHQSKLPWNDPSGDRLREWLAIDREEFYDPDKFAIIPMGFCYPGKGKSGDLAPKAICAPTWHPQLIQALKPQVSILIGQYAQQYYLKDKRTLTERVQNWQHYLPKYIVLPHPSPRNNIWLKKHPWFAQDVLPEIRQYLKTYL